MIPCPFSREIGPRGAPLVQNDLASVIAWCKRALGPCEVLSDEARIHGRTAVLAIQGRKARYYVKVYRDRFDWEVEAYAYVHWAPAFGERAPRLVAVREEDPPALAVDALDGIPMAKVHLSPEKERAVWRAAGQALMKLHTWAKGTFFGPCRRDGRPLQMPAITEAPAYVLADLDHWVARGERAGCLTAEELALIASSRPLVEAFRGELPIPCHRDYGPANWLIAPDGTWAGVIDFEFSRWDVRISDFTRYPDWEWFHRLDLIEAFFEGYGRFLTPQEEVQCLFGHVQYAVAAIVWGCENGFHGFEAEGREALQRLAPRLK